jgi:transglutaminase-like putative cysteine protease
MAHAETAQSRVHRLTSLVAMLAVGAAIALAFGRVFEGSGMTQKLLVTGAATALVAWILERRSLLLATLAEVGLLALLLGLLVFRDTTWHLLPGFETLRAVGEAAGQVGEQARLQAAPAPPVLPLVFATVAAVWAAVFSCHALAFRAGSPILALIPPGALIVFADSVLDDEVRPLYGIWLLVAALAVLFADSLRRMQGWGPVWGGPGRSDRLVPGAGLNARRVAATVLAVAVAAPFVMPGFGGRAAFDLSAIGRDDGVAVSALVSMASELNDVDPTEVFEVNAEVPAYWRMTALERFDGVTWQPSDATPIPIEPGAPLPGLPSGEPATQRFTVLNDMLFLWLPATYQPRSVSVPGRASWEPGSQTIVLEEPLREGAEYTVTSTYVAPTPEDLRAATLDVDASTGLTDLPPSTPVVVGDIAAGWTADAETPYDQIMAIQEVLTGQGFTYDPTVAYREDIDTIVDFLTVTRAGFCQQFATAMAVLLRSLGIPARVAVGFTRGDPLPGADRYSVSTDDLHAWVEVPFEGYGWLAFEPTKGRTNPIASAYNDLSPELACRGPRCGGRSTGNELGNPRDPVGGAAAGEVDEGAAGPPRRNLAAAAGASAAIVALGLAVSWLVVRRRRRRAGIRLAASDPRRSIVDTYRTFTRRAGAAGASRLGGETPAEYRDRLRATLEDPAPIDRLTDITVAAAYGRTDPTPDEALDALTDADEVIAAMKRRRGRTGRART